MPSPSDAEGISAALAIRVGAALGNDAMEHGRKQQTENAAEEGHGLQTSLGSF